MVSFFSTASNDQSLFYLDQMFGYMNGVLPVNTGALTIMGTMLQTINTTALVIGSIVVVHTVVMGLLKTAQEGEFLGRQWSSFWVPFRTIAGIAALFPTAAGYSVLQTVMMWIIVQGIGAADTLWTTTLSYVVTNGSPYAIANGGGAGVTSTLSNVSLPPAINSLLQSLTCQTALHRSDADLTFETDSSQNPLYYCGLARRGASTDQFCTTELTSLQNITSIPASNGYYTFAMGPGGTCGSVKFADPVTYVDPADTKAANNGNSNGTTVAAPVCSSSYTDVPHQIECAAIKQQVKSLQEVVTTEAITAAQLVQFDNDYYRFKLGVPGSTPPGSPGTGSGTGVPAPTYIAPTWISNYCTAMAIPASSCCSASNVPACTKPSNLLYDPFVTNNGVRSFTSSSTSAGTKIYWTYGLGPVVGLTTNPTTVLAQNYAAEILAATTAATSNAADLSSNTSISDTNSGGWITAGAYYYYLADMNNSAQTANMPSLSANYSNPSGNYASYRNLGQTASDVLNAITSSTSTTLPSAAAIASPTAAQGQSALNGAASGITNNFINELSGGGISKDPVISAQAFGEDLLIAAQTVYPIVLAVSVVGLVASSINPMGLGSGLTRNPFGPMTEFLVLMLWGGTMLFCGWAFTFGGMLAIYLPLVPYIIFTFGAIGWFIAVIEAMVAAPFVAIGILSPTGHDMLGRAEPAIMIMLNTFLRPTLMIFGMMAGMILAPVVVTMINSGFNVVVGSIYGGSRAPGPLELVMFLSAYATLIVTALNKSFALIYMIPERVLTWIGGQAISYGEGESLGAVRSSVEGAAGMVKSSASSAGRTAMNSAAKAGQAQRKGNEDKAKAGNTNIKNK